MEEKIDEVYQEYLEKRLDKVFEDTSDELTSKEHVLNRDDYYYRRRMPYSVYTTAYYKKNMYGPNAKPLCKESYDEIREYVNDFAIVRNRDKYNLLNRNGDPICEEWYERVFNFHDGYALVMNNGKCNYIDTTGKPICKEWYDNIYSFIDGYALVMNNHTFNVVDRSGNPICEEWYDSILLFNDGCARVELDNKYNYIDKNGKLISKEWFDYATEFEDGIAVVENKNKYKIIDTSGNPINDEEYNWAGDFSDGYVRVKRNKSFNFIDRNGMPISKEGFSSAYDFKEGFACVLINGKYNFINKNGNPICEEGFDEAEDFKDGVALVKRIVRNSWHHEQYNYIDQSGKPISEMWFSEVESFSEGYARVRWGDGYNFIDKNGKPISEKGFNYSYIGTHFKNGFVVIGEMSERGNSNTLKYNLINTKGQLLRRDNMFENITIDDESGIITVYKYNRRNYIYSNGVYVNDKWLNEVYDYKNGIAIVKCDGRYNFIDENRKVVSDVWFDYISEFRYGYALVKKYGRYNFVDTKGNCVLEDWVKDIHKDPVNVSWESYPSFIKFHGTICPKKELGDYKVEKKRSSYICKSEDDEFTVGLEPVKIYDKKYVLCVKRNYIYVIDRTNNTVAMYRTIDKVEFKDNFIFDYESLRCYFIYNGSIHDVTEYFCKNLSTKQSIVINDGVSIMPKESFSNNEEIREKIKKELEEDKKREAERKKELERKKLQDLKAQNDKNVKKDILDQQESLYQLKKFLVKYVSLSKKTGIRDRISFTDILIHVNNHLEIDPIIIEMNILPLLNLSSVSFKNVKMSGIDFSGCNISFNPQEVYNKDLSNCNLEGIYFPVSTNFTGVNICGTKFTNDGRATTFDISEESLSKGIYDENTTLNGIPLTELIKKK